MAQQIESTEDMHETLISCCLSLTTLTCVKRLWFFPDMLSGFQFPGGEIPLCPKAQSLKDTFSPMNRARCNK